ncbi:beta-galactosidase [Nakamurella lactea]|uniref:beta-galactosidase n=1 Tax=Nakamurella lactea TaxID=459515 RepID=UPI00040AD97A|nr:beta-galactosidase [Nakamurella lactea]
MALDFRSVRYGGDYNPEHWPVEKLDEDVELMRQAGVNLVSVGIFGWATAEPTPGAFDFSFYRTVLDRLHAGGIGVCLATMTASPPPWLSHRHPEMLPQRIDGVTLSPGARQQYCPSCPVFRDAVGSLVEALAAELGDHPAVQLWHLHNEYGCHLKGCWCDVSAAAFRTWLQRRYGSIQELNRAWTTTFWSQGYSDFAEILPPRVAPTFPNNAQQLDFARFSSDELQDLMRVEVDILRRVTPNVPLTTNFAAVTPSLDLWKWAPDLDVVSFDNYPDPADPSSFRIAAMDYDIVRSLRPDRPWLLMEQAPSAVNWRTRNAPKPAGKMRTSSWQAVAHGSDSVMFFQWRASPGGAEKFHSAMVGHTGPDSRVFREITALGSELAAHQEPTGLRTRCDTALLLDWDSWWAGELDSHPTGDLKLRDQMLDWHTALGASAVPTDAVHPGGDLSRFRLLIAPSLYLITQRSADNLADWVAAGGTLVLSYFSGVADERDRIHPGGAPGPLRDLVGATVQEWWPLQPGEQVRVSLDGLPDNNNGADGARTSTAADPAAAAGGYAAEVFSEDLVLRGAEVIGRYVDGGLAGGPAVLRNRVGNGTVYYLSCRLDPAGTRAVLDAARTDAGVRPLLSWLPDGVEAVRRGDGADALLFVINHTSEPVAVALPEPMSDLLTDASGPTDTVRLNGYGVAMLPMPN